MLSVVWKILQKKSRLLSVRCWKNAENENQCCHSPTDDVYPFVQSESMFSLCLMLDYNQQHIQMDIFHAVDIQNDLNFFCWFSSRIFLAASFGQSTNMRPQNWINYIIYSFPCMCVRCAYVKGKRISNDISAQTLELSHTKRNKGKTKWQTVFA